MIYSGIYPWQLPLMLQPSQPQEQPLERLLRSVWKMRHRWRRARAMAIATIMVARISCMSMVLFFYE